MIEQEILKAIFNAGTGAAIAIIVLIGIYNLFNKIGIKFIASQQEQTKAINRLTNTLEKSIDRDQLEHREMFILLKVVIEKIEHIQEKIDGC